MTPLCIVAKTQRELDDALRLRWTVFGQEKRLLGDSPPGAPREVDCFDTLESTVHLIVYMGLQPVATTRLLLPNPEVVQITGTCHGLSLEQKIDLSDMQSPTIRLAESTRYCVLEEWRRKPEVLICLQAGLYEESLRRGVTHWVGSANMESDSQADVAIMIQVAAARGWVSPLWRERALAPSVPPVTPSAPFYTPGQRAQAHEDRLEGLKMPRTLSLFVQRWGARFISKPLYDAYFHRFSIPLIAALSEFPASTRALFKAVSARASRAA